MTPITYDFGEVKPGTKLKHSFFFEERILESIPDCGCTATKPSGNKLTVEYTAPDLLPDQDKTVYKGVTVKTENNIYKAIIKLTCL